MKRTFSAICSYLQLRMKKNACKKMHAFDLSFNRNLGDAITRPKMFKMKSVTFGVNTQPPTVAETLFSSARISHSSVLG